MATEQKTNILSKSKNQQPSHIAWSPRVDIDHRNWLGCLSFQVMEHAVLVMDRENGKWVMFSREFAPIVALLATPLNQLPTTVRLQVESMAEKLRLRGLSEIKVTRPYQLNTLILKLTTACNYACTYCYDYEQEEKGISLGVDDAISAIDQALDICSTSLHVIFHGGEPMLMFDRIRAIIDGGRHIADKKQKRIVFSGQTNLSRLDEKIVAFSLEHDLRWGISLDGPPQVNDHFRVFRNGHGTHRDFTKALDQFPGFVKRCGVLSTITSANQNQAISIARYFRDIGMPSWDWTLFQPIGRGRVHESVLEISSESLLNSWEDLFTAVEGGEFDGFAVRPVLHYINNFLDGPGSNMCMRRDCGAARDLLSVSADGTLEACDCLDPLGPFAGLGKISDGNSAVADAKASYTANKILSRDVAKSNCSKCIWLSVCGGTCLAHAPGLHERWDLQCSLSQYAFNRIAESVSCSTRLADYRRTCERR